MRRLVAGTWRRPWGGSDGARTHTTTRFEDADHTTVPAASEAEIHDTCDYSAASITLHPHPTTLLRSCFEKSSAGSARQSR